MFKTLVRLNLFLFGCIGTVIGVVYCLVNYPIITWLVIFEAMLVGLAYHGNNIGDDY